MGFLSEGNTFSWEEASMAPTEFVRKHGVVQFLAIYHKLKDRTRDSLRWGDEIEYIIVANDKKREVSKLSLRGHEILETLAHEEEGDPTREPEMLWRPEYARYMIEGTPGKPFGALGLEDLVNVQPSMARRRKAVERLLHQDELVITLPNFPLLGAVQSGPYTVPHFAPGGPVARSVFTPDEIIHPHYRFSTLTRNIRERKGSRVEINVPLFKDKNTQDTPLPVPEGVDDPEGAHKPYNIFMDSMAFGMGCCCLQTTFQCCNIKEARHFYDQLAVLSPIMLALSAASPIFRGYLADIDVRWNVICASVDDRTPEELGKEPLSRNKFVINKSRYSSIDCYISQSKTFKPEYNDVNLIYDPDVLHQLLEGGLDELLARHIAHLFIRDPLVIYRDKLTIDDEHQSDHFENIQSTNWQTVRFKPPPPDTPIGWRVEFRPCEVQLTDFENAAYSVFVVLLSRLLSAFDINMYIPLSKVEENMAKAHKRGAVLNEKFYFRNCLRKGEESDGPEYDLMTIGEIMNGKVSPSGKKFTGLIELMNIFLDTVNVTQETRSQVSNYLNFLSKKASGELMTTATWIRKFVEEHPDYKHDSVITQQINHDIMEACARIGSGELHPPELFGDFVMEVKETSGNVAPACNGKKSTGWAEKARSAAQRHPWLLLTGAIAVLGVGTYVATRR